MEIELKYLADGPLERDKILKDKHLESIKEEGTEEEIEMKAVYFDTGNLCMCRKGFAFRIRYENGIPIATLKWGGKVEGGLHTRGELNVPVDVQYAENPSTDIFKGSDIWEEINMLVGDKKLVPIMEVNCVRQQYMVDTGRSINVISLDVGEIITQKGSAPISEVEIELYSGDCEDMKALGKELAAKYNLREGVKSKFQVGLEILGYDTVDKC